MSGHAVVCGDARVSGRSEIKDHARVEGHARVSGQVVVSGHAQVKGDDVWLVGVVQIGGTAVILGGTWSAGKVTSGTWVAPGIRVP